MCRESIVGMLAVAVALLLPRSMSAQAEHTAAGSAANERAIRDARAEQNKSIVAGDFAKVAELWTDDVAIRRGLGQLVVGRDAYRELFEKSAKGDSSLIYQRDPTSVVVSSSWPLAYEGGVWAAHLGRSDGPVVIRGQYSAQWVKRGERWLIRSEVYVALTCEGRGCAYRAVP